VFAGRTVLDAGGDCIGQVSTLYLDLDTGVVAFAGGHDPSRTPPHRVRATSRRYRATASITVACGKLLARRAVSLRPGQSLPVGAAADLFAHYDLPYVPPEPIGGRRLVPYI
jgi:hypothetical protein